MEELFTGLLRSVNDTPLLFAFLAGIATSISPCPLASNIAAIAFVSKQIENKRNVLWASLLYILGRTITYFVIGLLIIVLTVNKSALSNFLQLTVNQYLGPILIIVGILLIDVLPAKFNISSNKIKNLQHKVASKGLLGSLLLGMLFALAFCPISAVWFFLMIGIALKVSGGFSLPLFYGIGTGLPVALFAILLAFSVSWLGKIFKNVGLFEKWFRLIAGIVFIIIGIYLTLSQTFKII